jgi:nucleotide-binding universal stress UspA family protein
MNRFKNILFVADKAKGEQVALGKILELAELNAASVTVMDVLAVFPDKFYIPEADADLRALHQGVIDERRAEIARMIGAAARKAGTVKPCVLLKEGIDYIEIIREVVAGGYDLVVKASDNNTAMTGVLFGTLDMHLLRKCPCPVFVMKPRRKIVHSKVLAAVDLNTTDKKRSELDRQIVQLAATLAGMEDGTLDVVHAWHLPYEKKMREEERIRSVKTVELVLKDLRATNQRKLDALTAEWAALVPRSHQIKGEAHQVLPRFVREQGIDVVVMGTVGRSGVAGFFIGNTAEKILHALTCSVLAIKPAGFKSPVK